MARKYFCDICSKGITGGEDGRKITTSQLAVDPIEPMNYRIYSLDGEYKEREVHNTCLPNALKTEYVEPVLVEGPQIGGIA